MSDIVALPADPVPGVTPAGWYADPTSKTGERLWNGKRWQPYTKRPRWTPPGPLESYAEIKARREGEAVVKAAEQAARFAEDYPELDAQSTDPRGTPAAPSTPVAQAPATPAPVDESALNAEVAKYARQGYTITDRAPGQVILQRKQKIGAWRILIFVVLAITIIGLFLIPLIARALNRKMDTVVITLDASGKVRVRKS